MIKIFKRSEDKYNVQYTEYIGGGDSKTYLHLVQAEPYGHDVQIEKIECIGLVGKRFGYQMRRLKISMRGKKLSYGKGVFGKGRLTLKLITSMQTYYTGATRNNPISLCKMIRAIWAIWYHMSFTDDQPQHQFCPIGRNSWCKYQQVAASNQDFHHEKVLPRPVMDAINPVFVNMTYVSLLKRCLGKHMQNSNQSFNKILWTCPKNIFVRLETLKLGAHIATVLFNDGMCGILRIMARLDATSGVNAISAVKRNDRERLDKAEKTKFEEVKQKRIIYRKLRLDLEMTMKPEHFNFLFEVHFTPLLALFIKNCITSMLCTRRYTEKHVNSISADAAITAMDIESGELAWRTI